LTEHQIARTVQRIRPFTMVPEESLRELARQVQMVVKRNIPGDFVECGVWRGGTAFLMADLLRAGTVRGRKVWLFDSFEGLPAPERIDGQAALAWAADTNGSSYFENCRASLEEVQQNATELGLASYTEFVKGWFDQTLVRERNHIGPIAILRIDCDWYASVRVCLDSLYDQVVEGGFVILDDYYVWDGCARAVHEFLGARSLAHRLEGTPGQSALFMKTDTTTWRRLKAVEWSETRRGHISLRLLDRVSPWRRLLKRLT
jgi:O-methyltransferase